MAMKQFLFKRNIGLRYCKVKFRQNFNYQRINFPDLDESCFIYRDYCKHLFLPPFLPRRLSFMVTVYLASDTQSAPIVAQERL